MNATTVSLEIAKKVIRDHGVEADGEVVSHRQLGAAVLSPFSKKACAANGWYRGLRDIALLGAGY